VSGGTRRNLDWVRPHLRSSRDEDELLLLADAQTSGGLLVVGELPGHPVVGELVAAGRRHRGRAVSTGSAARPIHGHLGGLGGAVRRAVVGLPAAGAAGARCTGGDLVRRRAGAVVRGGRGRLLTHAPLSTEHLFRVASHSKTFTATAVFQLLEAGRLRLDDAASTWLPFLDGSPIAGVTVRQLLAHTSGIIRDGKDSDYWQLARPCPDAAELREISLDDAAVLPPAERFKYSNIAYSLLGSVIEAASGQPYNTYVTEQIVVRLGLRNTGPELDPEPPARVRHRLQCAGLPRRAAPDRAG
jgi:CubicO group peptidase (beta-lactamase class C family)